MSTFDVHANFASSTVATAPSPATSGTSLVVAAGTGVLFPTVPFNATIYPVGALATSVNAEVVRVTAIVTDTLTIVRVQESSSARTVIIGDQIAATVTKKTLTDIEVGSSNDGWFTDTSTWYWATTGSFSTPVDSSSYLYGGTKVSWNDGSVKYAQLSSVNVSTPALTGIASTIGTSLFTKNAHGLSIFFPVTFTSGVVTTTGISMNRPYWPVNVLTNTFQLALAPAGAVITLGGTADTNIGTGTTSLMSVTVQSDVTMTNAAFTAPRYSYSEQPRGYPFDFGEVRTGAAAGSGVGTWTLTAPIISGHPTVEGTTSTGATGTGKFVFDTSPTINGHPIVEGVTSTGSTGTGKFVFDGTPLLVTPNIGVATGTSLAATGKVTSSGTAGIGYATGAGGTVTQATNKGTAFTLSKTTGTITFAAAALAANTNVTSTWTNTTIAVGDVVVFMHISGGTLGAYGLTCTPSAGSAVVNLRNLTAGSLSEAPAFSFVIIKGVTA